MARFAETIAGAQTLTLLASTCLFVDVALGQADHNSLTVRLNDETVIFRAEELLGRTDLETILLDHDNAYPNQAMSFQAIRVATLLKQIDLNRETAVEFTAWDGFAAIVPSAALLNTNENRPIAYLAIEPPNEKWPTMASGETAGPFYLVWLNAHLSDIAPEQWPYGVVRIESSRPVEMEYPAMAPSSLLAQTNRAHDGFRSFIRHCLPCHTVNLDGPSTLGPDLNIPMNPTEYFSLAVLRQFIRDPQSVRYFPRGMMPPFSQIVLPDEELDDLIIYLEHMRDRKGTQ